MPISSGIGGKLGRPGTKGAPGAGVSSGEGSARDLRLAMGSLLNLPPFLVVLVLYALLLMGLGIWLSRRIRHSHDFFVADRRLGPGLLFSTLLAANIGAGSTVGAAGLGYSLGLSGWWWVGSAGLGSLILAFTVGPRIRDLAARHDFLTVGDFLEYRYGRQVRALVSLLLWAGTLFILAGQLIAFARILEVVAGTSKTVGCLLGGIVVVVYFSLGGLKGSAWINLVQLLVKAGGFLLAVPLTLAAVGGWSGLKETILAGRPQGLEYFSLVGIGSYQILSYLVLLAPSFIVSPGLLQKIYGARDARTVRLGVGTNAVVLLAFSFLPVLLGMAAAAASPGRMHPDLALPYVMTELVPFWLGALLLAAVFSAEVSSADAILFMLSTSLSRDLYQTFLHPGVSDRQLLRISRGISFLSGTLGVGVAILVPSVIDALSIFYSLLSVALFVPLILGLYRSRPGVRACQTAIGVSVPAALLVELLTGGRGVWILSSTAFGILVSLAVMLGADRLPSRGALAGKRKSG